MPHFGDRLKSIRKEKGLSQEEFAKLLNTSKQVISRYETNQRTPKITVAAEYSEILGVSVQYLLGSENQPKNNDSSPIVIMGDGLPQTVIEYAPMDNTLKELLETAQSLPSEKLATLVAVAKSML